MEEINEIISKENLIDRFEILVKSEDILSVKSEVKALYQSYYSLTDEEKKVQLDAFNNNEEREENEVFEFVPNPLDNRFLELKNIYTDKQQAAKEQKRKQEKENLDTKLALLEELKSLVESDMQNPGAAFSQFYEIRDKWDATGEVNKANFKDLQYDYSHYRDLFYYNVGIFNQLKTYDFRINGEKKIAIIEELKELLSKDSIKVMEHGVKELQNKWDKIGPTTNEQWELIKNAYWDNVNAIYEKIKMHYQAIRDKQALAADNKNNLLGELQALHDEMYQYKSPQQWSSVSSVVNELHKKWKKEDFSGKDKEDKLWENFSYLTEEIRKKTNDFFDSLKEKNAKVEQLKKTLIEKAEQLKTSTDWRNTTEAFKKLQKEWKRSGNTQYKKDQELWTNFRKACDTFFEAKKHFFNTMDDRQTEHLRIKNDFVEKIKKSTSKEDLIELVQGWQAVGYVPKSSIKKSENDFDKAVSAAGKNIGLQEDELFDLRFKAKVAAIKADENAVEKLKSERRFVQGKIDKLKEEMTRYQENMAFFGPSKGAQKLKEVVEKKVAATEEELKSWQDKLSLLK